MRRQVSKGQLAELLLCCCSLQHDFIWFLVYLCSVSARTTLSRTVQTAAPSSVKDLLTNLVIRTALALAVLLALGGLTLSGRGEGGQISNPMSHNEQWEGQLVPCVRPSFSARRTSIMYTAVAIIAACGCEYNV